MRDHDAKTGVVHLGADRLAQPAHAAGNQRNPLGHNSHNCFSSVNAVRYRLRRSQRVIMAPNRRASSTPAAGSEPYEQFGLEVISKLTVIPKRKAEESAFLFDSKADSSRSLSPEGDSE